MDRDPGLLCFKHCQSDIFALLIPNRCPECDTDLSKCSSITPFRYNYNLCTTFHDELIDFFVRIPFPFRRASQYPCSVVLKPTKGDFLRCATHAYQWILLPCYFSYIINSKLLK
jgi:Domain of unknown function (DUF4796)